MRWALVVAGQRPPDISRIRAAANATSVAVPNTAEAVRKLVHDGTTEGIVVCGSDADLAQIVAVVCDLGTRLPLALVPHAGSDLLRMFGLDRNAAIARLPSGSSYPADLGWVRIRGVAHPFVAHAAASPAGRPRVLARSAAVVVTTPRRTHRLRTWWVIAANAQHISKRTIAPKAALMDGRLDVQAFAGTPPTRLRLLRLAKRGLHLRHPALWRRSIESCSVETPTAWRIALDGVAVGSGPFDLSTEAGAYDLWI